MWRFWDRTCRIGSILMNEVYLWRFYWDARYGCIEGLFTATHEEIDNLLGKDIDFGEVLGKHSEVYGTIEAADIWKLDVDPEIVAEVSKTLGSTWSGYNPIKYISE
jgi:hypothetical protein